MYSEFLDVNMAGSTASHEGKAESELPLSRLQGGNLPSIIAFFSYIHEQNNRQECLLGLCW